MAAVQVLLAFVASLALTSGQLYNGYINPMFLPRGYRAGRYLDTDLYGANPYGANLYGTNSYGSNPYVRQLDLDYRRALLDPRYDDARRYQSAFGPDRLYSDGLGARRLLPEDIRYLQLARAQGGLGLATTAQPLETALLDRGQLLDRSQLLDRGQLLDRTQLLGRLDRGQSLSTASPELSVTVSPNSST